MNVNDILRSRVEQLNNSELLNSKNADSEPTEDLNKKK